MSFLVTIDINAEGALADCPRISDSAGRTIIGSILGGVLRDVGTETAGRVPGGGFRSPTED